MSKVSHREVDHENDGFIFLADEATQNPQGCTVGQKTRNEYENVGGCIQGVLKCHTGDTAVSHNIVGTVATHLEYFSIFTKVSREVMIPEQSKEKKSLIVNQFFSQNPDTFFILTRDRVLELEGTCIQMNKEILKEDILLIQAHPVNDLGNHGIIPKLLSQIV